MNNLPINQIVTGDCRDVMSEWPSECIDFAMFSPPYWGLRDYGEEAESVWGGDENCDHVWGGTKEVTTGRNDLDRAIGGYGGTGDGQVGKQNTTTGSFCQKCGAWRGQLGLEPDYRMYVQHLVEVGRAIKRVLKPSGSWYLNLGDTYSGSGGSVGHTPETKNLGRKTFEYGAFPTATIARDIDIPAKCKMLMPYRVALALIDDGWICRNDLIWLKPNPMPSSVKDRLNTTTEKIFHFVKKRKYYYDLDAIREEYTEPLNRWGGEKLTPNGSGDWDDGTGQNTYRERSMRPNPEGKNPGDVIEQTTQPFPEAHFAVYPPQLCEKPIKSSCPKDGIVLDPMCGAGSTLLMAEKLGRKYIGIEISPEYADMARRRVSKSLNETVPRKKEETPGDMKKLESYINL